VTELDTLDRALLEQMQSDFPLTARPFAALGRAVGLDENEVLARVRRLKQANIIRQIGAIFDTRRLGYQSTLVAFHVADESLEAVAEQISAHPGVSHNYARPHHYSLWFTLAVPPGSDMLDEIGRMAERTGVRDWLNLPATRMFKLRTHFKLGKSSAPPVNKRPDGATPSTCAFTPADIPFVRALQRDLDIVCCPFAEPAGQLGLSQEDLLDKARELTQAGIMRRFGAVLRHRRVGYTANGMACWVVPEEQIEAAGHCAAAFPHVSHCYQRPAYPPRWPYTLFTMVHGQTKDEVEAIVAEIAQQIGIKEVRVLYSTREFKKERVRYFAECSRMREEGT
jgi:DNA-binding Lrp family transcriptional regulator